MKHLNKIFGLGIVGLTTIPAIASCAKTNTTKTIVINTNRTEQDIQEQKQLRCTIAYVGKKCTKDGKAIIARTNDASPKASNSYLKKVNHNELANATIKNDFGFEYKMPSTTLEYISSPDGWTSNPKDERHLWQSMGINELGVGITCTLTCFTNPLVEQVDPFLKSGIAEEAFNQILAAQATSARNAMEIAADVIDKHGSQDANIIMATDQNETWLMEIYTGHEYCAVKLPDDKVLVGGNEFLLDSLHDLGINDGNKQEMCITSPKLLQLVSQDHPELVKWIPNTLPSQHDIYHLDLFNTYAGESDQVKFSDGCHMRTWRGYSLWDPTNNATKKYEPQTKYPPLFVPKDSDGNVRKDMSIYDVIQIYRDEFDDILNDPTNINYEYFKQVKDSGNLRSIATETARLVHIITSDPNLPKEIAVNALYCPSSANYVPFVLLNNGITSFNNDEYAYCPQRWTYDEKNASVLFRKINSIAWPYRSKYGYQLQELWNSYESVYISQMQQVIADASKLSSMSQTRQVITNFNNELRAKYINTVKYVGNDLLWHDMNQDHRAESKIKPFVPLIDMQEYLTQLGWSDFNVNGNTITFKYQSSTGKLVVDEGYVGDLSKLTIDNKEYDIRVNFKDNKAYVGISTLNEAIGNKWNLVKIDINNYLTKEVSTKNLALIISLSIGIPIVVALSILIPVLIIKKKKDKLASK